VGGIKKAYYCFARVLPLEINIYCYLHGQNLPFYTFSIFCSNLSGFNGINRHFLLKLVWLQWSDSRLCHHAFWFTMFFSRLAHVWNQIKRYNLFTFHLPPFSIYCFLMKEVLLIKQKLERTLLLLLTVNITLRDWEKQSFYFETGKLILSYKRRWNMH